MLLHRAGFAIDRLSVWFLLGFCDVLLLETAPNRNVLYSCTARIEKKCAEATARSVNCTKIILRIIVKNFRYRRTKIHALNTTHLHGQHSLASWACFLENRTLFKQLPVQMQTNISLKTLRKAFQHLAGNKLNQQWKR